MFAAVPVPQFLSFFLSFFLQTPRSRVLLEELIVLHKFYRFMEPEGSLPCSQQIASCPILSQINPFHNFPLCSYKIHSNIVLSSTSRSSEWSLPFGYSDQNFVSVSQLIHVCYLPRPSHPPFDLITLIISGEAYKL